MDLIKAPQGHVKCRYAFFPGCGLTAEEPEITAKIYDALLFQNADTAMFSCCCGHSAEIADPDAELSGIADRIRTEWQELGRPEMILACPGCINMFERMLPDIPVVSLYEVFQKYSIGGGCNSVDYAIFHPPAAGDDVKKAVKNLAEDMGVRLHPVDSPDADTEYPIITYSIALRDRIIRAGHDSAHILELMFGMGECNTHLIHEHDHDEGDDCGGSCVKCTAHPASLPDEEKKKANREELKQLLLALYWDEQV